MLIIARKRNERIHIGEDIEIVISDLSRSTVKVAISAPKGTRVLRGEIYDEVAQANRAATGSLQNASKGQLEARALSSLVQASSQPEVSPAAPARPTPISKEASRPHPDSAAPSAIQEEHACPPT